MGICAFCKKSSEETKIFPGILATEMIHICEECAEDQKVPIIKKPSNSQLSKADKHYSVRERLDRMAGRRDSTEVSKDQIITQKNLSKLRAPKPKQNHPDVVENYYWNLSMARRRIKMTSSQLANKIGVNSYDIQDIERGRLPENFKEMFLKLEAFLGIKMLKVHEQQINFTRKNNGREDEILKAVAEKMRRVEFESEDTSEEFDDDECPKERISKRNIEEIRFSRRENLNDITLNDLVERKREKEKYEMKIKQDEMLGDDIDLEEI